MDFSEILALCKDIILILGSLIATFFTIKSFSKWKKEHRGKIRYELGRNVLKSMYNLRDDFQGVRSPFTMPSEFSLEHDVRKTKESEKTLYVMQNRLKYLQTSYNTFLSLLPEIEIEYDQTIYDLCIELTRHIMDYHSKVGQYIGILDNPDWRKNPYYIELHNVMYNTGKNNPTTIAFEQTIEKLTVKIKAEIKK